MVNLKYGVFFSYIVASLALTIAVIALVLVGSALLIIGAVVMALEAESTNCSTGEIVNFLKMPICGKGAVLLFVGIAVFFILYLVIRELGKGKGWDKLMYFIKP